MRDLLPEIERWRREGKPIAIATVVKVWGSAPRPLGSKMAITSSGDMAGSVSGGCVEGAVFEEAQAVLASGEPKQVGYGVTNDEAWAVGLSCGGRIEIFIEKLASDHPAQPAFEEALAADELVALATVVGGPGLGSRLLLTPGPTGPVTGAGGLGSPDLNAAALAGAKTSLRTFAANRQHLATESGEVDLFLEVHPPRPKLVIVGAVHAAIALVGFAKTLGMRTVVVDPRGTFATHERFPHADVLSTDWPDQALDKEGITAGTYLALLSHDLKLDLPALRVALAAEPRYIGALGSKKTHGKRVAALEDAGLAPEAIGRIHNPIGLNLGGRRAEEIAVAVIAEIVAVSHGIDFKPVA